MVDVLKASVFESEFGGGSKDAMLKSRGSSGGDSKSNPFVFVCQVRLRVGRLSKRALPILVDSRGGVWKAVKRIRNNN